jgi:hypothetical protein
MSMLVPMRAMVPKELRRQVKVILASKEITIQDWFRAHVEKWIAEEGKTDDPPMAG